MAQCTNKCELPIQAAHCTCEIHLVQPPSADLEMFAVVVHGSSSVQGLQIECLSVVNCYG